MNERGALRFFLFGKHGAVLARFDEVAHAGEFLVGNLIVERSPQRHGYEHHYRQPHKQTNRKQNFLGLGNILGGVAAVVGNVTYGIENPADETDAYGARCLAGKSHHSAVGTRGAFARRHLRDVHRVGENYPRHHLRAAESEAHKERHDRHQNGRRPRGVHNAHQNTSHNIARKSHSESKLLALLVHNPAGEREHTHRRHHKRRDYEERGHILAEKRIPVPHVRRIVGGERGNHIETDERRHIHDDVPAVRAVPIRLGIVLDELFAVEFFLGSRGLDALFDEQTAYDQTAAEKNAEHYRYRKPEFSGSEIGQEEISFGLRPRVEKEKRQHIRKSARRGVEHQFHGVGVVALLERGGDVARHRTVRHHRYCGERIPQQIHHYDISGESADGHSPVAHGHKQKEYTQNKQDTAEEHIRFSAPPLAASIIRDESHNRVGYGVPEFRDEHYRGRRRNGNAVVGHIFQHHAGHQRDAAAVHKRTAPVGQFFLGGHVVGRIAVRQVFDRLIFCTCFCGHISLPCAHNARNHSYDTTRARPRAIQMRGARANF